MGSLGAVSGLVLDLRLSGRLSTAFALLLILFGSLLNLQCWFSLDLFRLHYFGIAEQIMCSANASIPVVLFFVWLASGRMPSGWLLPLFSCLAFYSPLQPWAACQ